MKFATLSYQIQNAKTKECIKTKVCNAWLKSVSPELLLKAYLESKTDLNLI